MVRRKVTNKFRLVATGYQKEIRRKAREHKARGYTYRIRRVGRKRALYIGPRRKRTKGTRKTRPLRR